MEEDNYKFRLSAFRERLVEWLSSTPNRQFSLGSRTSANLTFPLTAKQHSSLPLGPQPS